MKRRILATILAIFLVFGALGVVACSNAFTVTFDLNGGTAQCETPLVQTVTSASEIKVPQDPKKDGYLFDGWDKAISKITTTTTITARWVITYTITFNGNGGQLVSGETVQNVANKSQIKFPVFAKQGYVLSWDKNINEMTSTMTVNAVWVPTQYKLYFDADGGTWTDGFNPANPITVNYGEIPTFPKEPQKENAKFVYWQVSTKGEYENVKIYANSTWTIMASNLTVKAIYIPAEEHSITYDLDGGAFKDNEGVSNFKSTDDAFALNNPIKTGYEFIGWTGEGYTTPQLVVQVESGTTKDLNFKANWRAKKYTISLDAGAGKLSDTKVEVTFGQPIGNLPIPEIEGVKFVKWTADGYSFSGGENTQLWEIDKALTLTAVYSNLYVIKFRLSYNLVQSTSNGDNPYTVFASVGGEKALGDIIMEENQMLVNAVSSLATPVVYNTTLSGTSIGGNTVSKQYTFLGWVYYVNGQEHSLTDKTVIKPSIANNFEITIVPKFKSNWMGPW